MSLAVIKDNHIKLFGSNFFVANAPQTSLGYIGEKATPIFGQNKLEVKSHIPAPKFDGKIKKVPPIGIDDTLSSKTSFNDAVSASLKVIGANVSFNSVYDKLKRNELKVVEIWVEPQAMKEAANKSPKALGLLRDYGKDARIVHNILVVMEAKFATEFTGALNYDVSANAAGIVSITATGGSARSGGNTVTLSSGTVLGYLLLKIDWEKGKKSIKDLDIDEWSIN